MNDKPALPIQHMTSTTDGNEDCIYVIDADGVLWSLYVNFPSRSQWKRVPIKKAAK